MSWPLRLPVPHHIQPLRQPSILPVYLCEKNCLIWEAQNGATPHQETVQTTKRNGNGTEEERAVLRLRLDEIDFFSHDLLVGCHGSAELSRQRNQRINPLVGKKKNFKDNTVLPPPQWTDATWSTCVFTSLCDNPPRPHSTVLTHSPLSTVFMH